jgi:hypothetical protein
VKKFFGGLLALVLVAGAGLGAGWYLRDQEEPDTVTVVQTTVETVTETETETVEQSLGLPEEVEETRQALLEAAEARDYDALRELIPSDGFSYTFGGPDEGGPIAYWQKVAKTTDVDPIETLEAILQLPYAIDRGYYVWPFAAEKTEDEMTPYERELLEPLGEAAYFGSGGYYGWRVAIEPDGTWRSYVAGD